MKKLLVYSHDAYGLGNIRRMLEIVRHLVKTPETSVLLLCGSPMIHEFRMPRGVDYIKLPAVGRTAKKSQVVRSLNIGYQEVIGLRRNLILRAALSYRPDLVLVDKKPLGIGNELELALTALHSTHRPPRMVLLLRDILDAPENTIEEWGRGGYHQAIADLYDKVLIVGSEEVFDAVREYRFPEATARKVRYCGYIARPLPATPGDELRRALRIDSAALVLVTAGGGADGYALMSSYLRGKVRRNGRPFASLLVHGPELDLRERLRLAAFAARRSDVIMKEFSDDLMACMSAADLVVSMAGYNTVCELLTLRKRAIIVPRAQPVQEQWMRAERLQALGLARAIHPDELTPRTLMQAVDEELARNGHPYPALQGFSLDGLPRIVEAVEVLLGRRPPAPVAESAARVGAAPLARPRPFGTVA